MVNNYNELASEQVKNTYEDNRIKKGSVLGIISMPVSLFVLFVLFAIISASVVITIFNIPMSSENSDTILGLLIILLVLCSFVGIVFGIANVFQKTLKSCMEY